MSDTLSGNLQENILVLLCFSDESASILVNSLDAGLFENDVYKNIAIQAMDYFNVYKETPKDHIADLLVEKLEDPKTERTYARTLNSIYESKDNVNTKYVLSQVNKFITEQRLKTSIIEAANAIKNGNSEEARSIIAKAGKEEIATFDPGVFFMDTRKSLRFLNEDLNPLLTGIQPFDDMKFGPAPGELMVVLAPPNKGKTFAMVQLGKTATYNGHRVLHISLEMSEEKMSRRYIQGFFKYSTSKESATIAKFERDEMGRFSSLDFKELVRPVISYKDDSRDMIVRDMRRWAHRWKLYVKRFPTNGLSIKGLEAYLDGMERFHNFVPELLLVDYADLMQISGANVRIDTGIVYKELRRIAVERNIAVVTASQTNRLAEDAKVITVKHLAEDYSKAATADNIFAYCQTPAELKLGLARLFIAKARDEERDQSVLISQSYRFGQFALDAILMNDNRYWSVLESHEPKNEKKGSRRPLNIKKRE